MMRYCYVSLFKMVLPTPGGPCIVNAQIKDHDNQTYTTLHKLLWIIPSSFKTIFLCLHASAKLIITLAAKHKWKATVCVCVCLQKFGKTRNIGNWNELLADFN